ncbi:MAG: DNA-processing protein DprA [bacterium]
MLDESAYTLGLTRLPSFGAVRLRKLLSLFGSAEALWRANRKEFCSLDVPFAWSSVLIKERSDINLEQEVRKYHNAGITFLPCADPRFPDLLKEIPDAPIGIYVRGELFKAPLTLAVVGTRRLTSYGSHMTNEIVQDLASVGVTIVSGLALGIDGVAHTAALEAGGRTVAVLACGLDDLYPHTHAGLAHRMVEHGGAVISEFPLGTPSLKHHFPIRNRIIAGCSSGVLVTEAPKKSGALLTAKLGLDYNRDIFALPGPVTSETSVGTNHLIRDGAMLIECAQDILEHYHLTAPKMDEPLAALTETEQILLAQIGREPLTVDQIQNRCRLNTSVINATLLCLQMKGWIVQIDPLHYLRNR